MSAATRLPGSSSGVTDSPSMSNPSLKRSFDSPSSGNGPRQLESHKSSASMYISSVLASSATSTPDLNGSGTKLRGSIHKAAEKGNTEAVLAFIRKKRSLVNSRNEHGHVPLHIAALHNSYDVVDLLIRNEADVNVQDNFGWTPLHFAASSRNERLVQLLLDCPKIDGTCLPLLLCLLPLSMQVPSILLPPSPMNGKT